MRRILGFCLGLILVAGISCTKYVTTIVVHKADLAAIKYYHRAGSTVQWTGPQVPFQIVFSGKSPCDEKKSTLSVKGAGTAICVIKRVPDATWSYTISEQTPQPPKTVLLGGPFPFRVGPCDSCMGVELGGKQDVSVATDRVDGSGYVVSCDTGTAQVLNAGNQNTPVITVSNGAIVNWFATGQGDPTATITFTGPSPCGQTTLGPSGGNISCPVNGTSGTSYPYTVTHSASGCQLGSGYSIKVQ